MSISGPAIHSAKSSSSTEARLARIWSTILDCDARDIRPESNFLSLGGKTTEALRALLESVLEVFDVVVEPKALAGNFSLREMARVIASFVQEASNQAQPPVPRLAATSVQQYPLVPMNLHYIERTAVQKALRGNVDDSNHCLNWLIRGPFSISILRRALEALSQKHETLRTRFVSADGKWMQEFRPEMQVKLEISDLPAGTDALTHLISLNLSGIHPDRSTGPLLHTYVLRASEKEHYLTLVMDHAVVDGASIAVLVRELKATYNTLHAGKECPPTPVVQAGDLALQEEALFHSESSAASKAYFHDTFVPSPPAFLPSRPTGHVTIADAGASALIPQGTYRSVEALAQTTASSVFTIYLAMFAAYQHRESKLPEFRISTAHAGRYREELYGTVGNIFKEIPVPIVVDPALSFEAFVKQVWEAYVEALRHQHVSSRRALAKAQAPYDFGSNTYSSAMLYEEESHVGRGVQVSFNETSMQRVPVPPTSSNRYIGYSLELFISKTSLNFLFDSEILSKEQATEGLQFCVRFLKEACTLPKRSISELLKC